MAENGDNEQFMLTLTGNGIEIKRDVSQRQLAIIMSVLMGEELIPGKPSASNTGGGAGIDLQMSLREYLDQVNAVRKPDQIVAIGHYISLYEGQPTFSRADIKVRFAVAKEPVPANYHRDFGVAIKAGMVAEAHQKPGQFYVTRTGIQAIEQRSVAEPKNV